eukprot:gene39203-51623_t
MQFGDTGSSATVIFDSAIYQYTTFPKICSASSITFGNPLVSSQMAPGEPFTLIGGRPSIVLKVPPRVGACQDLIIDASSSGGSAGRD